MPQDAVFAQTADGWRPIAALLAADGSQHAPVLDRLTAPRTSLRELSDAVHCVCLLHGHRPGLVDIAAEHADDGAAKLWLERCAADFAREREWLARLVSAAGPIPSTVGQTATETTIAAQRHAIEMLAHSERRGCALGAATALTLDWAPVRRVLDRIGERLGLLPPASGLPTPADTQAWFNAASLTVAQGRAFLFGMQQLLNQQRGLWDLIDTRAAARAAS